MLKLWERSDEEHVVQFIYFIGSNWGSSSGSTHEAYLYYQEAEPTIDANDNNKHLGWKSDNVGYRLDHGIGTTSRPVGIPLWWFIWDK